jgi:hypothetical protein
MYPVSRAAFSVGGVRGGARMLEGGVIFLQLCADTFIANSEITVIPWMTRGLGYKDQAFPRHSLKCNNYHNLCFITVSYCNLRLTV